MKMEDVNMEDDGMERRTLEKEQCAGTYQVTFESPSQPPHHETPFPGLSRLC